MKRKRGEKEEAAEKKMEIVWQTPANPPEKHDYIFRDGNFIKSTQQKQLILKIETTKELWFCFFLTGIRREAPR